MGGNGADEHELVHFYRADDELMQGDAQQQAHAGAHEGQQVDLPEDVAVHFLIIEAQHLDGGQLLFALCQVHADQVIQHTLLLTLVYGPDGESPVDDSDLTEHLDSQMYELAYVNIPLYNTSTFVSASDDQKAQMLQLAQAAAASCSETQDGSVSEQVSALHSAASAALPDIYAVLDSTPAEDASNVQTELLTESDLTGAFTQDGAADAVRGLVYGEAAAVQYNAASIILMMRIDPLQVSTLDALRTQILSDMKGDELEDALTAYGSTLENNLSTSAMNKMPASKIVNPSSSSNS